MIHQISSYSRDLQTPVNCHSFIFFSIASQINNTLKKQQDMFCTNKQTSKNNKEDTSKRSSTQLLFPLHTNVGNFVVSLEYLELNLIGTNYTKY